MFVCSGIIGDQKKKILFSNILRKLITTNAFNIFALHLQVTL